LYINLACNDFDQISSQDLFQALKNPLKLNTLSLSHNNLMNSLASLGEIMQLNEKLMNLDITDTKLGISELDKINIALHSNSSIQKLNLSSST